MFDDLQRLRDNPCLVELLSHYADLGKGDRTTWQDRVMQMEGLEPKEVSKLHGELIACDWIEQNSGQASVVKNGVVCACYRVTLNGMRELARFRGERVIDNPVEAQEGAKPKFPRKKKSKGDSSAVPERV